jgi:hypothetical protein
VFAALQTQRSQHFRLYPQLPIAKLFSTPPFDATAAEKSLFYKASVDYTLCDQDKGPVVSVEFDGIGGGFSRDGKYLGASIYHTTFRRRRSLSSSYALRARLVTSIHRIVQGDGAS